MRMAPILGIYSRWAAVRHEPIDPRPAAELPLQTVLIGEGIYPSDRLNREVSAEEIEAQSVSTALVLRFDLPLAGDSFTDRRQSQDHLAATSEPSRARTQQNHRRETIVPDK